MSKIRNGFVTNSSSSSFIISRDQVKKKKLIKILLEIANKEYYLDAYDNDNKNYYTKDDVTEEDNKTCVAGRYIITKTSKKHPETIYPDFEYENGKAYEHHWIIDNDSCGRYNWDVVYDVLDKYGITWEYGYCD